MGEGKHKAERDKVISSMAYALKFKGPKASRIDDDRARWGMAEAVYNHLDLCGYELWKEEKLLTFSHLMTAAPGHDDD